MNLTGLGHQHAPRSSPVHRFPAPWKLGAALLVILGTVAAPAGWIAWYLSISMFLCAAVLCSGIPVSFWLKRMLVLAPFVLGVAIVNAFEPIGRARWIGVTWKSGVCLLTVMLVSNTTPFSQILKVLRTWRMPALLITTVALMHRYLFVLADEAERMRRARSSRTFSRRRRFGWRALASVVGQLFVRASERAERIYDAMCARGWR
jgi:cobalt/nickel transport system permease protein